MEVVEVFREVNKDYDESELEKKCSLRSMFLQALGGNCISLWEDLSLFVASNVDFLRSVKDEAEFKYFANLSMKILQILLNKHPTDLSSSSMTRLRSIFVELSEVFSTVLYTGTTLSNMLESGEPVAASLLTSWDCSDSDLCSSSLFTDEESNDEPHYIFSTFGILAVTETEQEHLNLTEWFSEAVLCEILMKNSAFRYLSAWKSFVTWRQIMNRRKFRRINSFLSNNCLIVNPVYARLFQVVQSPLNIVQFCAEINRNLRYNTVLMSHVTNCIFIAFKYAREINQTLSITETWKKSLAMKNELEKLRNQLNSFPNLFRCIRYRLISYTLNKFQSSIQDYINEKLNLSSKEERDTYKMNINKDIMQKNFRLVIYPVLLKKSEKQSQLIFWPPPSTVITIFKLTFEQLKDSLHLNETISENELTQIYFNEEKEIQNIRETIDSQVYANSIVQMFYKNSVSFNLNSSKHTTKIPWNIISLTGLEETNVYIRDMVHSYLPSYANFEKGLIPEHQFQQNESILSCLDLDQPDLNIRGHNCFPTIENASQMGLRPLIEQQCKAMKLYDSLMIPWSKRFYEKTNNIILSIQWIIDMNETINELDVLLQNKDFHTELHRHQPVFQASVEWINHLINHIKYENVLFDNENDKMSCFILIDYNPLFNLLYNEMVEKLNKLFSLFITTIQNSFISINNQLDEFIQKHANIQSDFNGFIQVVMYLHINTNCYEHYALDHDNLCRQVESFSPDYWNHCSKLLNIPFTVNWKNCTVDDLMKDTKNNLLKQKYKLEETWKIFQYLQSIQQIKATIASEFLSLNIQFISMNSHSQLIKSVHSSFLNEYIEQTNQNISERRSFKNKDCAKEIRYPWIFLNIDNLIGKLYELSCKLQGLLDSEHVNRIKSNETTNEYLLENDYYLLKQLNQIKDTLCNIKLIQNYWLYLYRSHSLNQYTEECGSSQFIALTDNYAHLQSNALLNDQVIIVQSIECEDNELIQIKCINLKFLIEIIHCQSNLWLTLKDALDESVNMFDKSLDEITETFPHFCLLSKLERIELLSNWCIPYCDYAAPLNCSIENDTDQEHNSYQYNLNHNLIYGGLINLNKWIKRLFPFLIDFVMITKVINEFNQFIELSNSLIWIPSICQWFTQFCSQLKFAFLSMTLNSLLEVEENNEKINGLIAKQQMIPAVILELTIRIFNWRKLEKVIRIEDKKDEFNKIIEYFEKEQLNNIVELLKAVSLNSMKSNQLNSRVNQLTYQILIGTILGFSYLVQDLKKASNLDENNFIWQRLIKTQLISSIFNNKGNDNLLNELNEYNEIPTIGIKQFSTIHLYKWDNQSLLTNNNTSFIPLLPTSQELIKLGSALNSHQFGLLIGSFGIGKQTMIRQLAFLLGRCLVEFSSNIFNDYNSLDTFEKKLKNDILNCARVGCLFSIMNIHFVDYAKNLQQSVENINKNGHKLMIFHQMNHYSHSACSKQCLFNQHVAIDPGFGLLGTFDSGNYQHLSKGQRLSFRNITIGCPNYSFIVQCLLTYYFPEYQSQSVKLRLVSLFDRSLTYFMNESIPNYKQTNIYYLSLLFIIRSFEIAKQFWLEKFHHLQEKRKQTALKSSLILRKEEDRLAQAAIIYGLTKVYRINLSADHIKYKPENILIQSNLNFNWLLAIEQYLSLNSAIPFVHNDEEHLKCDNYICPKVSWEFIHRLLREISVCNLEIIDSQLIKIIELWQLIHLNHPIVITGPVGSGKSTILKILISAINWYHSVDRKKSIKYFSSFSKSTQSSPSKSSSSSATTAASFELSPSSTRTFTSPSSYSKEFDSFSIQNKQNNESQSKNDDDFTLKESLKFFNIPGTLNSYLNKFDLISTHSNLNQSNVYEKIISFKHLFPYSDEHLMNFCLNDNNVIELEVDRLNISEEWLLLDLSDQSIEYLTFLNDINQLNLLKAVKTSNFTKKWFIEKTTIDDFSPSLIHQFSILSTEVNNVLNWLHLWRIWRKTCYSSYMIIQTIWEKILNELVDHIPKLLDQTWELMNQWCFRDENSSYHLWNMKSYKNAFCQQTIRNCLSLMSEMLNQYFLKEIWELRKDGIKPCK
ncbi:unnamed protein product [Schistosoma turkestanicum]|nr:unnamed protein product [Schistosoma turkestanicum]